MEIKFSLSDLLKLYEYQPSPTWKHVPPPNFDFFREFDILVKINFSIPNFFEYLPFLFSMGVKRDDHKPLPTSEDGVVPNHGVTNPDEPDRYLLTIVKFAWKILKCKNPLLETIKQP